MGGREGEKGEELWVGGGKPDEPSAVLCFFLFRRSSMLALPLAFNF